ncbi:hypothetical protein CR203_21780 [Salipaludibacillus neizhouensis]|uniref:G5 domain-containing protein n=1 Tax=Salipaludibacillus neizhouensis TaxID=885475 RepID=A0A3A9K2Q6_9BACI|nr:G5 and 3D domain-containing protein [Salipaludibacillus neizhouensis]RKL65200.1 hypothetical protein CR203_21780 [Salipaludibacillus neizhouensis]
MNQWMKQLSSKFSWKKLAVSSVGLLTLMSIIAFAIYEVTKAEVTVEADDDSISTHTHASTVGEVLEEQDIDVTKHDYVEPPVDTEIKEEMSIEFKQAQKVVVSLDGELNKVWTTKQSVEGLLEELEIEVHKHDIVDPNLENSLNDVNVVKFNSAFQITVISDGEEKEVWTTSTTVADFLEKEKITLNKLDRVEPAEDEQLEGTGKVNVVRVEKVTDVVEETVNFGTVTKNDSSIDQGSEEVIQKGQEGKIEKQYEVVIEDGEEVSRDLVKENVVQESEDRILVVGTKKAAPKTVSRGSSSNSSSSASSSSGSWRSFTATAYSAFCNGCSGVTATGINLRENPGKNVIAVDPSVIPLGSRVEVKGYGTYIAGDTGGAIKGNKIDIFMPDKSKVQSFGRQSVQIRVLD